MSHLKTTSQMIFEALSNDAQAEIKELAIERTKLLNAAYRAVPGSQEQQDMKEEIIKLTREISKLKHPLKYESVNEDKPVVNKFGCLMVEMQYDDKELKAMFEKDDLCQEEGGVDGFSHVTALYGFHEDVDPKSVLQFAQDKSNLSGRTIDLNRISLFKNERYDVVKFDVMNSELNKLNKMLAETFPNTNKYPAYHAHVTIGYVLPGLGEKYLSKLRNYKTTAKATKFVYSTPKGKKTEVPI